MPAVEDYPTQKNKAVSRVTQQPLRKEERIVGMHEAAAFLMDVQGIIQSCNESAERISGYAQHELLWQHISCLFPQFVDVQFVMADQLNPLLNYLCHCEHMFEARNKQGETMLCNLCFFKIKCDGVPLLRLILRPCNDAATEDFTGADTSLVATRSAPGN
jgi:PAS domain S-box-containing protein